ncbi:MAG: hypothetical protein ACXW3G_10435 [Rhodoplanes sp.]
MSMKSRPLPKPSFSFLTWQAAGSAKEDSFVDQPVCKIMAEELARSCAVHQDVKSLSHILTKWCKDYTHDYTYIPLAQACNDYLTGAAQALNPLPPTIAKYYESDAEALHSDWISVWSDLNKVWTTTALIHELLKHASDDQHAESESANSGQANSGKQSTAVRADN